MLEGEGRLVGKPKGNTRQGLVPRPARGSGGVLRRERRWGRKVVSGGTSSQFPLVKLLHIAIIYNPYDSFTIVNSQNFQNKCCHLYFADWKPEQTKVND